MEAAIDAGLIRQNPAKGVSEVKYEKRDRQPWPEDKIAAFRAAYAHGTRERLCFELLLGTGQRIGDVLRMQWGHIDGEGIRVKQGKTGKRLWAPLTPHLAACLAVAPRAGLTILTARGGRPWAYGSAAQQMRKAREAVGALEYDLHGLRYAACVELFLAGCTDEEISAITGQSVAMVLHYTRLHRQKVLAMRAKEKRK
jgi:integrase